ncbi:MAG: hypothetical protein V4692_00010 [Bdellovibrionota bacterium]
MKAHTELQLDRFVLLAAENMQSTPDLNSLIYSSIKEIDEHWLELVFAEPRHTDRQVACTLVTNAHSFFRASVSLILTGQPTPVYALLRIALESSLYAAMVSNDLALENVWLNRTTDATSKAACRREFSATKALEYLEAQNSVFARDCKNLYEMYIEYGAHPNIFGTFTFIEPALDVDLHAVRVNYLQGNSRETRIAAFQAVQLAEVALHLAIHAMPNRTNECETIKFLEVFSPKINHQLFGL